MNQEMLAKLARDAAAQSDYREARKLFRAFPGVEVDPEEEYPSGSAFSGCEAADYIAGPRGEPGTLVLVNQMVGIDYRDRRLLRYTGRLSHGRNYLGHSSIEGVYPHLETLADWGYKF